MLETIVEMFIMSHRKRLSRHDVMGYIYYAYIHPGYVKLHHSIWKLIQLVSSNLTKANVYIYQVPNVEQIRTASIFFKQWNKWRIRYYLWQFLWFKVMDKNILFHNFLTKVSNTITCSTEFISSIGSSKLNLRLVILAWPLKGIYRSIRLPSYQVCSMHLIVHEFHEVVGNNYALYNVPYTPLPHPYPLVY